MILRKYKLEFNDGREPLIIQADHHEIKSGYLVLVNRFAPKVYRRKFFEISTITNMDDLRVAQ